MVDHVLSSFSFIFHLNIDRFGVSRILRQPEVCPSTGQVIPMAARGYQNFNATPPLGYPRIRCESLLRLRQGIAKKKQMEERFVALLVGFHLSLFCECNQYGPPSHEPPRKLTHGLRTFSQVPRVMRAAWPAQKGRCWGGNAYPLQGNQTTGFV